VEPVHLTASGSAPDISVSPDEKPKGRPKAVFEHFCPKGALQGIVSCDQPLDHDGQAAYPKILPWFAAACRRFPLSSPSIPPAAANDPKGG